MPVNAKMTTPAVPSRLVTDGTCSQTRLARCTKAAPISTKPISGTIFATVMNSRVRALLRTPRTLMTVKTATTANISVTYQPRELNPSIALAVRAKSTATAAPPNRPVKNSTAPAIKPTKGPSAIST